MDQDDEAEESNVSAVEAGDLASSAGALDCSPPRRVLIGSLLLFVAFVPALLSYAGHLWNRPHYQFFPLALGCAGLLVWKRLQERRWRPGFGRPQWVAPLFGVSLGLFVVATVLLSPWLAVNGVLLMLLALIVGAGGRRLLSILAPALMLLLLLVCFPLQWDQSFVTGLRRFAVVVSGMLLDTLQIPHLRNGNVLEIRNGRLLVDEACSGINSAFFVIMLSMFYGFWRNRPVRVVCMLVVSGLSFVLLGNVIRISLGAALKYGWNVDILSGWVHEAVGLVLFATYVGLILSADRLFQAIPVRPSSRAKASRHTVSVVVSRPPVMPDLRAVVRTAGFALSGRWLIPLASVFLVLGLVQGGVMIWSRIPRGSESQVLVGAQLPPGARFEIPKSLAGWQQLDKAQYNGSVQQHFWENEAPVQSHAWAYRQGSLLAYVSLDYPYRKHHDVTECYTGVGWEVRSALPVSDVNGVSFVEVEMFKEPFSHGYLLYGAFQADGQWFGGLGGRVETRFGRRTGPVYQVQALVVSPSPVNQSQRRAVTALFAEVGVNLNRQVMQQLRETTRE